MSLLTMKVLARIPRKSSRVTVKYTKEDGPPKVLIPKKAAGNQFGKLAHSADKESKAKAASTKKKLKKKDQGTEKE